MHLRPMATFAGNPCSGALASHQRSTSGAQVSHQWRQNNATPPATPKQRLNVVAQ